MIKTRSCSLVITLLLWRRKYPQHRGLDSKHHKMYSPSVLSLTSSQRTTIQSPLRRTIKRRTITHPQSTSTHSRAQHPKTSSLIPSPNLVIITPLGAKQRVKVGVPPPQPRRHSTSRHPKSLVNLLTSPHPKRTNLSRLDLNNSTL